MGVACAYLGVKEDYMNLLLWLCCYLIFIKCYYRTYTVPTYIIFICFFAGNLVGQIVDRMNTKIKNETALIPGTELVLYSAVSFLYCSHLESFMYHWIIHIHRHVIPPILLVQYYPQ